MSRRHALAALAALLSTSCVRVQWTRGVNFEVVPPERIEALVPGRVDLRRCLHELGAPHFVDKGPNGSTDLVWAFSDTVAWGISVSYPVMEWYDVSFTYDESSAGLDGLLLRFNARGILVTRRTGKLAEIVTGGRRTDRSLEGQRRS